MNGTELEIPEELACGRLDCTTTAAMLAYKFAKSSNARTQSLSQKQDCSEYKARSAVVRVKRACFWGACGPERREL